MKKAVCYIIISLVMAMLVAGCGQQTGTNTQGTADANQQQSSSSNLSSSSDSSSSSTISNSAAIVNEEQAKQIAYAHAGVSSNDVAAVRVKKEIDDGVEFYEVEFYTAEKEYDYEIKISDGSIWKFDSEVDDKFYSAASNQQGNAKITLDQARDTALAKVPGATAQDIHVTYEIDDGRELYEGTIYYNRMEYEFEIDANTGAIIQWEQEPLFG